MASPWFTCAFGAQCGMNQCINGRCRDGVHTVSTGQTTKTTRRSHNNFAFWRKENYFHRIMLIKYFFQHKIDAAKNQYSVTLEVFP